MSSMTLKCTFTRPLRLNWGSCLKTGCFTICQVPFNYWRLNNILMLSL